MNSNPPHVLTYTCRKKKGKATETQDSKGKSVK